MSNENEVTPIDLPVELMHKYNEFSYSVSVPKPVLLTEAEAEIIADYFLNVIYTIELSAGMGGWCHYENHMYPYSHARLEVLIKSGLITEEYIQDWLEDHPVPKDDPWYEPWDERDSSSGNSSDGPSHDLNFEDEIPF